MYRLFNTAAGIPGGPAASPAAGTNVSDCFAFALAREIFTSGRRGRRPSNATSSHDGPPRQVIRIPASLPRFKPPHFQPIPTLKALRFSSVIP